MNDDFVHGVQISIHKAFSVVKREARAGRGKEADFQAISKQNPCGACGTE